MKSSTTQRNGSFGRIWRQAFRLLAPVLLLGLTAATAAEPQADKAATVDVHLSEYAIKMPDTLPAGPTTFVVHNDGDKTHSFRIEGPGLADAILAKPVPPQETESLQVTLQPGEYKVYCPVGSHEVKGMKMMLKVTAKP
ncbi:MAG TPA: cupredoxin domain-containing protein [Thermoanaerobaculia bacterium]